jgi:hypothetical protein
MCRTDGSVDNFFLGHFLAMAAVAAGAAMMSAASPSCCRTSDDVNGAVTGQ